jgi:hypothetical protein
METLFSQADLNKRLVEAVVKLRLRDCKRLKVIAAFDVKKLQEAITQRLLSTLFADSTIDPLTELNIEMIEVDVELEVAKPSHVFALGCLASREVFDPEMHIAVKNVDTSTGDIEGSFLIKSLRRSFPFTEVFQPTGGGQCTVSFDGRRFLKRYADVRGAPEVLYKFAAADVPGQPPDLTSPLTLPAGWGLSNDSPLTGR